MQIMFACCELASRIQTCDAVGELLKVTVPELVDGLAAFSDGQHNIAAIVGNLEEEVGSHMKKKKIKSLRQA